MSKRYQLPAERLHYAWDNGLAPVLEIDSGDTVEIATHDSSDHYFSRHSTAADLVNRPNVKGHALTGPIAMRGAKPGDTLAVEVLEVRRADFGYTVFGPKGGLLREDFPEPYLRIWDLDGGDGFARGVPGVRIPLAPFLGVMGVALAEPGAHSTIPPRRVGGNMDVRQLTAGSTLYLPIEVAGALFSTGDAHAAQGDGEVCITAIEMDSVSTLRFSLLRDQPVREPQLRLAGPPTVISGPYHGCTAHAPDLMEATKNATRYAIEWLCRDAHLSAEDAYVVASVAAELRISQVVDAPNWTVTAFVPLDILRD
jgi:acetamidase/formamidase